MFAFDKPLTWIIILLIVIVLFGANKLPEIGKGLGRGIKEFKEETQIGVNEGKTTTATTLPPVAAVVADKPVAADTVVRRRTIEHPDGRKEVIEEQVAQK